MLQNFFSFLEGGEEGVEHYNSKKKLILAHNTTNTPKTKCLSKKNSKDKEQM